MIKNCCMISTWKMSLLGMKRAAPLLKRNVPVHEAILMAVKTVEDDPAISSVGYGGLPNLNGEVELDAAYMNGDTLGFGGVMSVKNIKNPIEVAFDLSHYQRNCLLSDIGATRYAQSKDFAFRICSPLRVKNAMTRQIRCGIPKCWKPTKNMIPSVSLVWTIVVPWRAAYPPPACF